jgi:multisubunit Na+/H+ antiporter MnhC subunit
MLPIPLLDGERVSTRLISLPFVFICIFAAIHFQDWLNQPRRDKSLVYLVTVAAIIIGLNDLWQNFRVWRVPAAMLNFKEKVFDPRLWTVANHADPLYQGLVLGGAVLSLASLGVLGFFTWRSRNARSTDA